MSPNNLPVINERDIKYHSGTKHDFVGSGYNIVWYVIHILKLVSDSIPGQGSSLSRSLFCESKLCTRFSMTLLICSNMEFDFIFSAVAHLGLIPYYFWIK